MEGETVEPGRILGLESRGWEKGAVEDGGVWYWIEKPVGGGATVQLYFEPGIVTGLPNELGDQTLKDLIVSSGGGGWYERRGGDMSFGDISAIAFSELVADLETMRA